MIEIGEKSGSQPDDDHMKKYMYINDTLNIEA